MNKIAPGDPTPRLQEFSASNLWRLKLLSHANSADEKLAPLMREIG